MRARAHADPPRTAGGRQRVGDERRDALVVEPGGARADASQRSSPDRTAFRSVGRLRRLLARDERALAAPALDEPLEVELAVGLQHRVRVDRERSRRPPSPSAAGRPGCRMPRRIACFTCWTSCR